MKGLAIFAVALFLFGWWYKTKDEEKTRISRSVHDETLKVCSGNTECLVRVRDSFSGCFDSAYEGGFLPGRGSVNASAFAKCFNYDMITMKVVVLPRAAATSERTSTGPDPSQTSTERAKRAGRGVGTLLGLVIVIYVLVRIRNRR